MGASKKSILIVEDNSADCFLIEQSLKTVGIENLTFAQTGEKAVEIAKKNLFDMAVVDTRLGIGMDGFETCAKLKEVCEGIKVIIVTGNIDAIDAVAAKKAAADDYLAKTIDFERLIESLNKLAQ